jgi:Ca2+-binding RTX toxin-like protein
MLRLLLAGGAVLVLAALGSVFTAANAVPTTYANVQTFAINANALKPAACAALNLTAIVRSPAAGTAAAELILGRAAADTINGAGGSDCILGGGGNDTLAGGAGTDVCIGGPGTDTFNANCETQIQ